MENSAFSAELQTLLNKKKDWFNTVCLQELLIQYRLLHTCVHNLFDTVTKKNIIIPDPYRLDKKISEITLPETGPFSDNEMAKVFGGRFSEYETMLDYICTYYRFTVDNLSIPTVKRLIEFNKVFEWENVSTNNTKMNTRALALSLASAKMGAPGVIQSMINDSVTKCAQSVSEINKMLNELGIFQRELYKGELRKDLFEHPDFNSEKALSSPDAEMAEIKRLYAKIIGKKKIFYNDLVSEIIEEDQSPEKDKKQQAVLARLQIKETAKVEKKQKVGPNSKELIMATVMSIGAIGPTLGQLKVKLEENFELIFTKKKSMFTKFLDALKQIFHIREKEKICVVSIKDAKTGFEKSQKLNVTEFMLELSKKERVYNGIGMKGPEYAKIEASTEDAILMFVNKQISEIQSVFTMINALDAFFKNQSDSLTKVKIKGMQIELTALRNSIVNTNKKRGEYANFKEEFEQMRKLGIAENE